MIAQPTTTSPEQLKLLVDRWAHRTLAPSTRVAYACDWSMFTSWCKGREILALPATPETVAQHIGELLAAGRKVTTAARHAASIAHYHREAGYESPANKSVWLVIAGARRERCEKPVQKHALTLRELSLMLRKLGGPQKTRNRAILLMGFATALRRCNLAGLDLMDVHFDKRGMLVGVRHEKNDRVGNPRTIAVPCGRTVQALKAWLKIRGAEPGPLFMGRHGKRLHPQRFAQIVQEAARAVGLESRKLGAHSLRAGFCTEGLARGVGEIRIAMQTGHRCLESLRRYFRPADPFIGNPCLTLGL